MPLPLLIVLIVVLDSLSGTRRLFGQLLNMRWVRGPGVAAVLGTLR